MSVMFWGIVLLLEKYGQTLKYQVLFKTSRVIFLFGCLRIVPIHLNIRRKLTHMWCLPIQYGKLGIHICLRALGFHQTLVLRFWNKPTNLAWCGLVAECKIRLPWGKMVSSCCGVDKIKHKHFSNGKSGIGRGRTNSEKRTRMLDKRVPKKYWCYK